MKFYLEDKETVLSKLKAPQDGLSKSEAQQRLEANGKNKLAEAKKTSLLMRFLDQLKNPMIIVLLAAALVSAVTAVMANESLTDVFIILAVVILNAVLGVIQESKAEKAIEALAQMSAATSKVYRDGQLCHVKSEDLVVGDVIALEAGDAVPADARIIEAASLKSEEAALTGESVPSDKITDALTAGANGDVPLGDRKNMLYMGSTIVYGRARAVITATGMETEMGKIADAITKAESGETPLQKKLSSLSKTLTVLVLAICVFMFGFSIIRSGSFDGETILDTFMIAVSLAVAAIPEGLAAVVTIVLSMGVTKMSKRNAVIRKLTAVETLGCTQIICSDKTGTLTQNKMTVVDHFGEKEAVAVAMASCSDAVPDESGDAVGEPTECALVNFATSIGIDKKKLDAENPRIGEAPFDSMRKMMSTVHADKESGKFIQYTKGAPDELLKCCKYAMQDGKAVELTDEIRQRILTQNKLYADRALRVLAAAFRGYNEAPTDFTPAALENELVFIGLCGMIDPVRPEVVDAIRQCNSAGIRPIMITGDHKDTATAIAKELGILKDGYEAITGADVEAMSDDELYANIEKYSVYARVQPEHKTRIVTAWKKHDMVTAMTGDGVNDAPSIKSADIGIGMGITGTDVTKNVADMVLADDNFATIVSAVEEGRRIYDNIRKAIQFLLSSNLSEVISIFIATVFGFTILRPVHVLWINLITDSLPALALGMEPSEDDIMNRKPRNTKDGIFSDGLGFAVLYQGLFVSILTVLSYFVGGYFEHGAWSFAQSNMGITMAFITMSMAEIFHSYNMRAKHTIFNIKSHNIYLFGAMALSFVLTTLVVFVPFMRSIFSLEAITFVEYLIAMGLALAIIPLVEIVKLITGLLVKKK